jgi:general secretion pathway protein A
LVESDLSGTPYFPTPVLGTQDRGRQIEYFGYIHNECLQKLELSILLRRGLNVIIGDVGTGKTTLCRQLIRRFAKRDEITTHLILDPLFVDAHELLTAVSKMLMGPNTKLGSNEWQIKEQIKQFLFKSGVKEDKTTILIIDEGQRKFYVNF